MEDRFLGSSGSWVINPRPMFAKKFTGLCQHMLILMAPGTMYDYSHYIFVMKQSSRCMPLLTDLNVCSNYFSPATVRFAVSNYACSCYCTTTYHIKLI
jgi:hypothetical protein